MRQRARQQLSAFIEAKRATDDRSARRRSTPALDPQRHFDPARHDLTAEQSRLANALLMKADLERPLRGTVQQRRFRHALRCAGILSAVKRGLVGNRRFGRRLQGHHGGNVMRDHASSHLRQWSPIARLAAGLARERKIAQEHYEATGQVLAPGEKPAPRPEAQHIQALNDAWEAQQWQQQIDRLRW